MLEDQHSLIRFYPQEGYLSVQIPSKNFEPSNPLMYADFIKLIKAEEHPYITIRFHFNPYEFYPEGQQTRSEEHTSELQSRPHLVCRLLLEKKKIKHKNNK